MDDRSDREPEASAPGERAPLLPASVMEHLATWVPHNRALGIRFAAAAEHRVTFALPYAAQLAGNPLSGVLHGGAITTLMDATCGAAVFVALRVPIPIATLDLRIDYLKPATPGEEVHARAECFKVTRHIAFVRCEAFHPKDEGERVAVANGTFILFRERAFGSRRGEP
jgi:uncharacterized protein (TIGR00369 family)